MFKRQNSFSNHTIHRVFEHGFHLKSLKTSCQLLNMDHVKRIWYLSPMRAAKVQASLRIRAVSPEPSLLAHTSSESRGTFRQKATSLAPLNGCACAVEICHDGMLGDTNSLDGAHMILSNTAAGMLVFCHNFCWRQGQSDNKFYDFINVFQVFSWPFFNGIIIASSWENFFCHMRTTNSLISAFAVHCLNSTIYIYLINPNF